MLYQVYDMLFLSRHSQLVNILNESMRTQGWTKTAVEC